VCPRLKRGDGGGLPTIVGPTFYAGVDFGVNDKQLKRQWRDDASAAFKMVLADVKVEGWPMFMDADRSAVVEAFVTAVVAGPRASDWKLPQSARHWPKGDGQVVVPAGAGHRCPALVPAHNSGVGGRGRCH
jgi:hypothetical protein